MKLKNVLIFVVCSLSMGMLSVGKASTVQEYDVTKPFPAFKIIDNVYYVGTDFQADYLIVTSKGDILINSGYEQNVPQIKASVEQLGFKWSDIKIILISHAHNDHAGGSALVKKDTGAKYMVMGADVPIVESGGKMDFLFGDEPSMLFTSTKVDQVLHDGEQVKLDNTTLVAHLTPGHTPGNTTWTMNVTDRGKEYHVVIVGATTINPGTILVNNSKYPNIAQDYRHTFQVLKSLPCDVFLGAHGMYFDLEKKYSLIGKERANPFIDPIGYKNFITRSEQNFQKELKQQESDQQPHN